MNETCEKQADRKGWVMLKYLRTDATWPFKKATQCQIRQCDKCRWKRRAGKWKKTQDELDTEVSAVVLRSSRMTQ